MQTWPLLLSDRGWSRAKLYSARAVALKDIESTLGPADGLGVLRHFNACDASVRTLPAHAVVGTDLFEPVVLLVCLDPRR